jgi:large subunit ribosomal protein L5
MKTRESAKKNKEVFGCENEMEVPRIEKVVVNVGVGRLSQQPNFEEKILPEVIKELSAITGQKPAIAKATKSIAGFKVREGQIVGLKVTLRRRRMTDFLERLINIVLPRLRDFRGLNPKSVDSRGNFTVGLKEQAVFPEINAEISKVDFGLEISIVSNAKNKEEAVKLYRHIGLPLKKI